VQVGLCIAKPCNHLDEPVTAGLRGSSLLPTRGIPSYLSPLSHERGTGLPHSMTGFGAAEGAVAGGRLRVEIRTVNHRFFNFAPKLPNELSAVEGDLRERVRKDLDRGHVSLSARWVEYPEREATLAIDLPRAEAAANRLRELKSALNLSGEVTLELVARQPEVLVSRSSEAAAAAA